MLVLAFVIAIPVFLIVLIRGMQIIPHQHVYVIQRLGRFNRVLESGPRWTIPFVDAIAYRHSLKEEAIDVHEQTAITQDNVSVILDGIVYVKIVDPVAASYGVKDPVHAVLQLVQTTMRSEVGKIPLDKTFEEREALNAKIVEAINEAAQNWGIRCIRYEIKDIKMPEEICKAMELQMTAERKKRAKILESEGERQSQINLAEGMRAKVVLESEAAKIDRVNRALGEAEAIEMLSKAGSEGIGMLAQALEKRGGERAASLQVAEKYLEAFRQLAKEGNSILLPSNLQHPAAMIAEAMAIYGQVKVKAGVSEIRDCPEAAGEKRMGASTSLSTS